jgi:hypothetical protein
MEAAAGAPVPAELLQGATLVDVEHNFSITAPAPDWTWSQQPNTTPPGTLYFCESPDGGEKLLVIALTMAVPVANERRFIAGFLNGFRKSNAARGGTMGPDFEVTSVDRPFPGSYRFEGEATIPPAGAVHVHGYIYLSDVIYVFQQYTAAPGEPAALGDFVRSFKLLRPVAPRPRNLLARLLSPTWSDVLPRLPGLLYLFIVLMFVVAQPFFTRAARPPFDNAAAIAAGVVALLVVARCVFGAVSGASAYQQGTFVGEGLLALLLAVVIASRRSRKAAGPICARCRRATRADARFCGSCGAPLGPARAAASSDG